MPLEPMTMGEIVLAAAGVALLSASGAAYIACSGGFLFRGLSATFVIIGAVVICAVLTPFAAILVRRRQKPFGGRELVAVVAVLSILAVGVLSWLNTRQNLRAYTNSSTIPSGLRVHDGSKGLFGSYMRFTGPPATIRSLIQSKGLVEVPAEPQETMRPSAFGSRERTKVAWGWWQPMSMQNPKFFFMHHESEEGYGWIEGWWVNGEMNEVYAFVLS